MDPWQLPTWFALVDPFATGTGHPWIGLVILVLAGLVAGILNTLAGGGSFLTLPLLIFFGLPAGVANGTNRIGVLLQSAAAVWSFDRDQVLDRRSVLWAAGPSMLGAILGTCLALVVDDGSFTRILAFLMVFVSLLSFWSPKPGAQTGSEEGSKENPSSADLEKEAAENREAMPTPSDTGRGAETSQPWILGFAFFLVGIYGGFVQAGVGFLILAATTFAGLDLVRGNAVKVLSVVCFTVLSLAIFAAQGKVVWSLGLALGLGQIVGGLLGARLAVLKGHRWVRGVVTAAVVLFAVKLWLG